MTSATATKQETEQAYEISGWTISAAVLSSLIVLFASYGIYALWIDDIGIVATGVWFFGLPVALVLALVAVVCLFLARQSERARGRTTPKALTAAVLGGCGALAVLLGMGLTYFW